MVHSRPRGGGGGGFRGGKEGERNKKNRHPRGGLENSNVSRGKEGDFQKPIYIYSMVGTGWDRMEKWGLGDGDGI